MNRNGKILVLILMIIAIVVGSILVTIKLEENKTSIFDMDQGVQTNNTYVRTSTKSWANRAWAGNVNTNDIVNINFVTKQSSVAEKAWVFDGLSCFFLDGTVSIVVGNKLKIIGSMNGAFSELPKLTSIKGLELLDTSEVKDMGNLFKGCSSITSIDLGSMDLSSVLLANSMFQGCEKLSDLDMSMINMDNAIDMNNMFAQCKALDSLSLPTTKNVESLSSMFEDVGAHASYKTVVNGELNTQNCEDMSYMFKRSFLHDYTMVENFDTNSLKNAEGMFYDCGSISSMNLSKWNTENIETVKNMFYDNSYMEKCNVSGWDVRSLRDCESMFRNCTSLREVKLGWRNVPNIQNAACLFKECLFLESIDTSCFDGIHIGDAREMFYGCERISTIYGIGFKFDAADRMFEYCYNLVGTIPWNEEYTDGNMANHNGYFQSVG